MPPLSGDKPTSGERAATAAFDLDPQPTLRTRQMPVSIGLGP
jgi:hypothetical protein